MSKKSSTNWSEQWLLDKGFVPNGKGGYDPPPIKSEYIKSLKEKEIIVEKTVIKPTPDFEYKPKLEWFISEQTPSKKNARISIMRGKKIINIPSNKYREYVAKTKMQWEVFGREFKRSVEMLDLQYPLNIEMTFTRTTRQRFDFFGPAETIADLMTDFLWIPDDDTKHFVPSFKEPIVDKSKPGTLIKILTK